jgi:hypothetical protein
MEEFHNMQHSQNIFAMNKPRTWGWAVHAARVEKMRKAYKMIVGGIKEGNY